MDSAHFSCLKLERTIRTARETFLVAHLAHEKMRAAFDTMQHIGDSENWERLRKMFTFEIDHLKAALDQRAADSIVQTTNLEALQEKLNDLYEEQLHYGKDLQALVRVLKENPRAETKKLFKNCVKNGNLFLDSSDRSETPWASRQSRAMHQAGITTLWDWDGYSSKARPEPDMGCAWKTLNLLTFLVIGRWKSWGWMIVPGMSESSTAHLS